MTIKTVFMDIDGVLRIWDLTADTEIEKQFSLPKGAVAEAAFRGERLLPAITGLITDREWRDLIVQDLSKQIDVDKAQKVVDTWSSPQGSSLDEAVLKIVRALRKRARVVLVSNATSRLDDDLAHLGLLEEVDGVINSSVVGYAKPSAALYIHCLTKENIKPDEAIFVDDSPLNIEAAEKIGMHGHLFAGSDILKAYLNSFGVLDSTA